ncbi:MAG: hypothetical protein A3A82_00505 [Candidatus Pacebacteria bacterium RIFCSPLOWO2_01_FULL_47_12]|nr:MAG: hypothetical protein A3J60_01975 [Candidatus Pacebacteria bacterium RIFCSPHIGHO2_02_FULL_46_9]OGJ39369.1 MAG: hypothetical protein A3A82_00505 [Candidatus Pacebacteria bacterium RIFCSPLOWO2_01_FULL_47_12]
MEFDISLGCQKALGRIKRKDTKLFKAISQKLLQFGLNPQHPSLRLHKLQGELQSVWSISITRSIRMVLYYREVLGEKRATFISVGTHKEVYK